MPDEQDFLVPVEPHMYIAIDLKSFFASVECRERKRNPLTTNLVVADASRTEKTICLAVTPSLKAYGIPGRARLFEVVQRVRQVNEERLSKAPGNVFTGESDDAEELERNPSLALSFIVAPPRMALYMKYSTMIYDIYLRYVAHEDMHVYSIDEVFMDVTHYLKTYKMTARALACKIIQEVLHETNITATAGIGTNLYLCKIAMDVEAKHVEPDENGVRIAELDETTYRRKLWNHRPLQDFWRVGNGYVRKLEQVGLMTMGDIARCSLGKENEFYNEDLLYRMFGVNAELLIDHAWGYEPCTISDIKTYQPRQHGIGSGQVLSCPYSFEKARLIVKEMTELLTLDLVAQRLVTDQMVLTIGYDIENLTDPKIRAKYKGPVTIDHYGRQVPKHAHGTANMDRKTSSTKQIRKAVLDLYDSIVDPNLLVRRINLTANRVMDETAAKEENTFEQMNLFDLLDPKEDSKMHGESDKKERKLQEAMLDIKTKFGKNAILKGMNLEEGATTIDRNKQIGGHRM